MIHEFVKKMLRLLKSMFDVFNFGLCKTQTADWG